MLASGPADAKARAIARVLAAEMHAGFAALREHCPMNLRVSYTDCAPPAGGSGRSGTAGNHLGLGAKPNRINHLALRRLFRRRCLSSPRSPRGSPAITCRLPRGYGLCPRPSGASVLPPLARHGDDRRRGSRFLPPPLPPPPVARPGAARQPAPSKAARPKTPPAPIPANPSPMCLKSQAAASASATPSAATKPWPTPRHGRNSWRFIKAEAVIFTIRKPLPPSR